MVFLLLQNCSRPCCVEHPHYSAFLSYALANLLPRGKLTLKSSLLCRIYFKTLIFLPFSAQQHVSCELAVYNFQLSCVSFPCFWKHLHSGQSMSLTLKWSRLPFFPAFLLFFLPFSKFTLFLGIFCSTLRLSNTCCIPDRSKDDFGVCVRSSHASLIPIAVNSSIWKKRGAKFQYLTMKFKILRTTWGITLLFDEVRPNSSEAYLKENARATCITWFQNARDSDPSMQFFRPYSSPCPSSLPLL